jgi:crotonobetainyl-CoA:carnitine CoA-transferase CaiB-like acyl-CoA transferase
MNSARPLDGVRILALEQMQALPFATQLLARLGAEVVKVEPVGRGESGRSSSPAMLDPEGRPVGATFLRNNLNKRSVCIDLKSPEGRELVLRMAPRFDVVAENSKAGSMAKLGLGYDDLAEVHPGVIYVSVSGFGNAVDTPYASWPAYASIVEAMSGIYEMKRVGDQPPTVIPVGALGDISAALFTTIGILAALRHRERTGRGQYVDIAMLDAMVAMTDIVTNFWSMGLEGGAVGPVIVNGFRADDGWFILQVGREDQFTRMAELLGHPEWTDDPRLATRQGWVDHLEDVLRPGIEAWAAGRTKLEACRALSDAGLAAGPCLDAAEVAHDEHLRARNMLVAIDRTDGVTQPVLVPGNPVKLSDVPEVPDARVPWLGEHTDATLRTELGLDDAELGRLRAAGTIG